MKFETILFDLDGTLLNTLTDLTEAVNHILEENGYPVREEKEIRRFLGNGAKNLITQSLPNGVDDKTVDRCLAQYTAWYGPRAGIKTQPYPGIPELLEKLQLQGVKMAVISNKGDLHVKALVKQYFPCISVAIGERAGVRRKPCPDSITEAMKLLGALPQTTAYLGDTEVDAQTAKNAGIAFLAAGWGFRDKEELTAYRPALFLDHPLDLLKGYEH